MLASRYQNKSMTDVVWQLPFNIEAGFSVCFWLRKMVDVATGTIVSQYLNGTEHLSLAITASWYGTSGLDKATFRYDDEDAGLTLTVSRYDRTRWTFWSLTIDPSTRTIYHHPWESSMVAINDSPASVAVGQGELRVGSGSHGSFQMAVDDIYLFTRTLSPADVVDIEGANEFSRASLVLLCRFHHQERWARSEYGKTNMFSVPASNLTDFKGQMIGSGWKLANTRTASYSTSTGFFIHQGGFVRWGGEHLAGCLCNFGYIYEGDMCVACPATSYQPTWSAATVCTDCAVGSYTSTAGADLNLSTTCINCPAGKSGNKSGDISVCEICLAGNYATLGSTMCSLCAAGKYALSGAGVCSLCPAGKIGEHEGANNVTVGCPYDCQPGFFSAAGSIECQPCSAGSFSGVGQGPSCVSCQPGKAGIIQRAQNESAGCSILCAAGFYSTCYGCRLVYSFPTACSTCLAGKYSGNMSEQCYTCPLYSTSLAGSAYCQCQRGYTGPGTTPGSCSACAAGTYKGSIGPDTCSTCPNGTSSPPGATECDPADSDSTTPALTTSRITSTSTPAPLAASTSTPAPLAASTSTPAPPTALNFSNTSLVETTPGGHPSFEQLDSDGDGYISAEEAASFGMQAFHFLLSDTSADGNMDLAEFNEYFSSNCSP